MINNKKLDLESDLEQNSDESDKESTFYEEY